MEQNYIHCIIHDYEKELQKIKEDRFIIQLVKEQTPELYREAVKLHRNAIYLI